MSERNKQTNYLSDRLVPSTANFVYLRSTGNWPSFYGYGYAFAYTGGLFIHGRSYRS